MENSPSPPLEDPVETSLGKSYCDVVIPLGEAAINGTFDLEKAVCSHGLFMMPPNQWDPVSKSLLRPLRLTLSPCNNYVGNGCGESVMVRVFQPANSTSIVLARVLGVQSLSLCERKAVVLQVRRMLRLSKSEEKKVKEFQSIHGEAKKRGFGRVFRSPTLFEDMVKCILLCNCQWPRTLSMAKALCELQLEMQHHTSSKLALGEVGCTSADDLVKPTEHFMPVTPCGKEPKKRRVSPIISRVLFTAGNMTADALNSSESSRIESDSSSNCTVMIGEPATTSSSPTVIVETHMQSNCREDAVGYDPEGSLDFSAVGNFPSPVEIASLDEKYLAKRCRLGYRAGRILKLAQGIVKGCIDLNKLEELSNDETNSCSYYNEVDEKLKQMEGFGPYTRGNVLMCMGFYSVVPVDSETIRHLKQVHARMTTPQSVQKAVEDIYGGFQPFQFLAYWLEVWNFYEEWFGKFSAMPASDYRLITASNMKVGRRKN